MYIPPIIGQLIFSEPFNELREKCKEVSGEWLPFNTDEYGTTTAYADELIRRAKVNWTYEIIELQNPHRLEMILHKDE